MIPSRKRYSGITGIEVVVVIVIIGGLIVSFLVAKSCIGKGTKSGTLSGQFTRVPKVIGKQTANVVYALTLTGSGTVGAPPTGTQVTFYWPATAPIKPVAGATSVPGGRMKKSVGTDSTGRATLNVVADAAGSVKFKVDVTIAGGGKIEDSTNDIEVDNKANTQY